MEKFENVLAGCFIALLTALDRNASNRAVDVLLEFAADRRTPDYERKFYKDLAESITEMAPATYGWLDGLSATLH